MNPQTIISSSEQAPIQSINLVASNTTMLPSYIPNIPWQEGFNIGLGNGVDAMTGYMLKSAVKPFTVNLSSIKQSKESFRLLRFDTDLEGEFAAHAGVVFNIGQVGVSSGASATLASQAKVSATSFSIIGNYTVLYESFDLSHDYELIPEAAEFARQSPKQFRERYGDYFVAGGQRGSMFSALLTYSSSNVESLESFSTKMNGRLHELFTAEGSMDWARAATEANIDVEVEVEMHGYHVGDQDSAPPSAPWSPSKVIEALSWFKQHERGVYRYARLQHYNTLHFAIPTSVGVDADVFGNIRTLHHRLSALTILAGSCPQHEERASLREDVRVMCQDVASRQASLAADYPRLDVFLHRANDLWERLQSLHRRYRFIVDVRARLSRQPTSRIVALKNLQHWTYGYRQYPPDSTIEISSTSQRLTLPPSITLLRRESTLTYSTPAFDRLIVGWEVVSHRVDGHNGSWRKLSQNMLLDTSGSITFRSWGFRGVDWELIIYHVDASLFNFPHPGANTVRPGDLVYHHDQASVGSILLEPGIIGLLMCHRCRPSSSTANQIPMIMATNR